ncbi:hypothetical protein J14TS5_25670 [Paenibacillus lautus]|nr:hypothetical protein J14TS5_25670 [Paenibacillus lautus]
MEPQSGAYRTGCQGLYAEIQKYRKIDEKHVLMGVLFSLQYSAFPFQAIWFMMEGALEAVIQK